MKMIKCKPGNKPCGKRCIPNKWKCDKDGVAKEPRKGSKLKTALAVTSLSLAAVAAGAILFNKIKSGKLEKTEVKANPQPQVEDDLEIISNGVNLNSGDEEVIKDFKSILEKDANSQIKKDLDKAISKTITAKELNKQYRVNSEIMAKIPPDVKISLADTNQQVFKDLGIEGIDAVYIPTYNKLIVNSSSPSENLSENLNRGLVHWYQNNKGLMMDYEEYANVMNNLTPIQEIIFENVEDSFSKIWRTQAVKLSLKDENKYGHIARSYDAFKRAEFEAFYLSLNWDKLEKTAKEQGLV